jgi:hypothetical protein
VFVLRGIRLLREHFDNARDLASLPAAKFVKIVRPGEVREDIGDIGRDGGVVNAQLPETLAYEIEEKLLQPIV